RVQLLPERQVRTLDVQLGDLGTLPERGDVRDEVGDLVGAVRRWLAEGLVALAGAGGHAPGGQVEVGGRGARVLQRRALAVDAGAVAGVARRAPLQVQGATGLGVA